MVKIIRSSLFAPGNNEKLTLKVFNYGSDEIIFDLEDAVPFSEKSTAREIVADRLKNKPDSSHLTSVRINGVHTDEALFDLEAVVLDGVYCIHIPKVESEKDVAIVDWVISQLEQKRNIQKNSIKIIPIIETPKGYMNRKEICSSSNRIISVTFGLGDFMAQTGISADRTETILSLKTDMVISNIGSGLLPPMDCVYPKVKDNEGFVREAELARMIGCLGKICIHPNQVELANRIFSPNEKEIKKAKKIVDTFIEQENIGVASFTVDGELVDYAAFEHSKRILTLASQIGIVSNM